MEFKLLTTVIGLIFVYLLLSIFAMVIMEVIATFLRMRGELLKDSLNKLLFNQDKNRKSIDDFYSEPIMKFLGDNVTGWLFIDKLSMNFTHFLSKISGFNFSKNLPSYLKSEDFFDGVVSYINNGNYTDDIEEFESRLDEIKNEGFLSDDAFNHLKFLLQKSQNNFLLFQNNVERWFNETMDRANTWYSRKVQYITLVVGLALSIVVNADTIDIFKKLNLDSKMRTEIVAAAENYVSNNEKKSESDKNVESDVKEIEKRVKEEYLSLMSQSQGILTWEKGEWQSLNIETGLLKFLGFLITATAISLGSNFWFDLLKKFINIKVLGNHTQKN